MATVRSRKLQDTDSGAVKLAEKVVSGKDFLRILQRMGTTPDERKRATSNPRAWLRRNQAALPAGIKVGFVEGQPNAEAPNGPLCFWYSYVVNGQTVTKLLCILSLNPLNVEIR